MYHIHYTIQHTILHLLHYSTPTLYTGDINNKPQLNCVFQSDDAQNEFLSNPKVVRYTYINIRLLYGVLCFILISVYIQYIYIQYIQYIL